MAGSSKEPKSRATGHTTPEAEKEKLTRENDKLSARLAAVEEKMGRITRTPTLGDKFKAAVLPKKHDPLAKLAMEREQLIQSLRTNREQQEAVASKLNPPPKVRFAEEPETLGPKNTVSGPSLTPSQSPTTNVTPPLSQEEDPLRHDVSNGYQVDTRVRSFNLPQEESPLRQDVSDGYQVDNRTRSFTPSQKVDGPLKGDVSKGYVDADVNVSSGTTSVSQNNALRGDVSGETLRAPFTSTKGYIDISGEPIEEDDLQPDVVQTSIEDPYAETNEEARLIAVSEQESLQTGVGDVAQEEGQVIGTKKPEGATFKMKSLEKQYLEKEKNAPSTTVKIDGKEVTVREKEWLFEVANEKRRQDGMPEITEEEWDKNLAHRQATTQYFNDEQRSKHEVNVKGGKLQQGSGKMKHGSHVFVMNGEGQIYAKQDISSAMDQRGRKAHVHHSSFLAGEDVAGAGELEVRRDGTLKGVTDRSGHYKPGEEQTKQALETLEHQGVSMDNVKFTMDRGEEKTTGMAKEFLQGQVTPEEQQHRQERIDSGKSVSDVSGAMEKTFKERHNVVDEVRKKGESVRDSLRKTDNAAKNETRLQQGMGKVVTTPKKGV
ncbi:hypothetical protein DES53_1247 [Roseimicrobium gellanilyticum]|uniref:Uncharacterized protein n=1 Tax=Roseimicrobium gellanilyticum TaxID=748857 RepID=A0A366H0F7_9BACT|nr:hypothetical protein [Roseimicrobium gellanilyticum]RBP35207.1 hypothetical protein DES53_1247 [Roseimicrobium gellanilyticum]